MRWLAPLRWLRRAVERRRLDEWEAPPIVPSQPGVQLQGRYWPTQKARELLHPDECELHHNVVIVTTAPPERRAQVSERLAREVRLQFGESARVEFAGTIIKGDAE